MSWRTFSTVGSGGGMGTGCGLLTSRSVALLFLSSGGEFEAGGVPFRFAWDPARPARVFEWQYRSKGERATLSLGAR